MLYCCRSYIANLWLCALDVFKVIYMCVRDRQTDRQGQRDRDRDRETDSEEGHVENKSCTYILTCYLLLIKLLLLLLLL